MTLDELKIQEYGMITEVKGGGALRQRLLDMGITPHTKVMLKRIAPFGDPITIVLRGYELTIRKEDGKNIIITPITSIKPIKPIKPIPSMTLIVDEGAGK